MIIMPLPPFRRCHALLSPRCLFDASLCHADDAASPMPLFMLRALRFHYYATPC